jgi:hypothetical protein
VPHSRDLRAIGQSLEMTHVDVFELENHGESYLVRSRSITPTCQRIINLSLIATGWDSPTPNEMSGSLKGGEGWLRYEPPTISLLDTQGRKHRRGQLPAQTKTTSTPSQQLRTLGEHLDRVEASEFKISWDAPHSVTIKYQTSHGENDQRTFSFAKLQDLGSYMRFRRTGRNR